MCTNCIRTSFRWTGSFLPFTADCFLRAKRALTKEGFLAAECSSYFSSVLHRALASLPSVTLLFGVTRSLLHGADTLIDLGEN